jgi:hypothetical protein
VHWDLWAHRRQGYGEAVLHREVKREKWSLNGKALNLII